MTIQSKNDIKGTPNGDDHDAQFDPRPKWPFWTGTGGRFGLESVAAFIGMRSLFPFLGKLFADSAYQGPVFHRALAGILPDLETEIVKRSDRVKGFVVQPRRWVVERTIAWLNRCRRLAKDWENLNRNCARLHQARVHSTHAPKTL